MIIEFVFLWFYFLREGLDLQQNWEGDKEVFHKPSAPIYVLSSVQSLSHVWLFVTPWIAAHQASLSITNSQSLPKLMSIESVMLSSHLILCHPLLLLPPVPPSIRVFSNESTIPFPLLTSLARMVICSKGESTLIYYNLSMFIYIYDISLSSFIYTTYHNLPIVNRAHNWYSRFYGFG